MVDNMSVFFVLRNKTSKDCVTMGMIRKMVVVSMLHTIMFSAMHISGKHNVVTDALSRFQISRARGWAPWLKETPTQVKESFYPWSQEHLK